MPVLIPIVESTVSIISKALQDLGKTTNIICQVLSVIDGGLATDDQVYESRRIRAPQDEGLVHYSGHGEGVVAGF